MRPVAAALADIATILEKALALPADAHPWDLKGLLIRAHTIAVIQCASQRRVEARATFAAFPDLERGPMQ